MGGERRAADSLPDNAAQLFLLVASTPDASTIQVAWGPTVVPIEIKEVVRTLEAISYAEFASPGGPALARPLIASSRLDSAPRVPDNRATILGRKVFDL